MIIETPTIMDYVTEVKRDRPANLYPFWDSTTKATDQVGSSPGTLTGSFKQRVAGPFRGGPSCATRFTTGHCTISKIFGLVGTVEFWFNWEDFSGEGGYASFISNLAGDRAIYLLGGVTARMNVYINTDILSPASPTVPQKFWNHYAFIATGGGNWAGYLNLAKVHFGTSWDGATFNVIGDDNFGDTYLGGLSMFAIYDYALSIGRLTAHSRMMRSVLSRTLPVSSTFANAMSPFDSFIFNSPIFST